MPRSSQESAASIWGSNEPDGAPSASPRSTRTPRRSSPSDGPESPTSGASRSLPMSARVATGPTVPSLTTGENATGGHRGSLAILVPPPSGPAASPARISASPASDEAWSKAADPASPTPSSTLWSATDLPSSSSKTYRDSSPVMAAATLGRSSVRWGNSGMGGPTGFSTLATSECRSDDEGCSSSVSTLASILQDSVPPRFFLSARAAAGILRRATKRGRELPPALMSALTSLASTTPPLPSASGSQAHRPEPSADATTSHPTTSSPSVRRLTPIETERLMGWPDGHTIVTGWQARSTRTKAEPTATKPKRDIS